MNAPLTPVVTPALAALAGTASATDETVIAVPRVRERKTARDIALTVGRIAFICFALWLFLSAIAIMKDGAAALAPTLRGSALTDSPASSLGFGWLGAMFVMSGSPVAVSALTFLNSHALNATETFTMLTGSRLGAAFVVLTVAFIYALRGKQNHRARHASLSIGIFSLIMTAMIYLPALLIGLPLLRSGALDGVGVGASATVFNIVKTLTGPAVQAVEGIVHGPLLFAAGLALLLTSVKLFDHALPEAAETAHLEEHADWRNRRWLMFGIGSLVALITMSVSVALTVLVPAVAKGYFRRRQVLPYIMGANITTLGDTLVTAFVLNNPVGVHVVIAELAGITSITALMLAFFYTPLTELVVRLTDGILRSRMRLACFVAALFCIPIVLIWAF